MALRVVRQPPKNPKTLFIFFFKVVGSLSQTYIRRGWHEDRKDTRHQAACFTAGCLARERRLFISLGIFEVVQQVNGDRNCCGLFSLQRLLNVLNERQ